MNFESWNSYKLSEICEIKYGKDYKSLKKGRIPVYGSGGIMAYVESFLYDKPSVLIPRKGTLSNLFYVNQKFWTIDALFWTIIKVNIVIPKYLFYKLKTYNFSDMNVGSAVPSLTTELLNNLVIDLPSKTFQSKTVNILSKLDNKIEINNKINEKLEKLAQTIYKEWIVDFEFPNEDGEPYKSSGGEMVESALGLIPKDWHIQYLNEILNFERGIEPGSKNYQETKGLNTVPFYRVGDLRQYGPVFIDKELADDKIVKESDVLVSFDGAIGRMGIGFKGAHSTALRNVHCKKGIHKSEYIYFLFRSELIQETMIAHANGTTILHASSSIPFLKTTYNLVIIEKFSDLIKPIYYKMLEIIKENAKLAKTRDLLLPKLMSGEISVPVKE